MLRVLFVSPSGSLEGGAARSLVEVLEALTQDGRIEAWLGAPEGCLCGRAREASIRVVTSSRSPWVSDSFTGVSPRSIVRRGRSAASILCRVPACAATIRAVWPDVVVSNTLDNPIAALAARRCGVPHVWWAREFVLLDSPKRYLIGERQSLRIVDRMSDAVATNSEALAEYLRMRIDPAKISVIRPAIDLESSPPLEPPRPGEPLRLLLLGRMSPEKGTELLLEALAVLRPHIDRVRVRVVGNSTPEYLEHLLARRDALGLREIVEFLPWRDGIAEIDDAHVVLMCSYNEAFGRVTAEALQRGRPVIAARSGGTCEMVIDGVNGILFTPRAPVSLGQAISRVAADSDLLRTLTQGAREVGSGGGSTAGVVDALVKVFDAVHQVGRKP